MTPLVDALNRISDVVGWGLIHFLWQGTALAIALGLTRLVLPRSFARARYVAGCATLAAMLLAPAITIWRLADPGEPASPFFDAVEQSVAPSARSASAAATIEPASLRRQSPSADDRLVVDAARWLPWMVMAWMVGVLACSVRLAGG